MILPPPFTGFKPMRACDAPDDLSSIVHPCMVSCKLDGIALHILCDNKGHNHMFTNRMKPLPNKSINLKLQQEFECRLPLRSLISMELLHDDGFQAIQSLAMSINNVGDFRYAIYDALFFEHRNMTFTERTGKMCAELAGTDWAAQYVAKTHIETAQLVDRFLAQNQEGAMVHTILGNYKYGDVSELDGRFLKIKPMHDAEAIIIGWNKRNVCGVEVDEFGSWQVEHPTMGKFDLGGQISDSMRAEFRRDISKYVGQQAVFKYQKHGMKPDGGPRSPIFKGIRYD